ncbi:MAG: thiamine pyrophosphate-dependent enzyme, partial [Geminicoccaceae bacterium]
MNAPVLRQPKDYATDQEVRWCPGCGDYAILKAVLKALADLQADPAQTVFVSGIGCAARFPYYVETYGFHTIHGRAPAVATGVKLANPDLDVWVVGGDGDLLSIGGNHLIHALRRNLDLQILLFNNEIYGLTKGQASPTSRRGTRSPSTPQGSLDAPLSALKLALGAG